MSDYQTGGQDSKPVVNVFLVQQNDSSFVAGFKVANFGEHPLTNLGFQILDQHSLFYKFGKLYPKYSGHMKHWDRNSVEKYKEFLDEYGNEMWKSIEVLSIPTNSERVIYYAKVPKWTSMVYFAIFVNWNNQSYNGSYTFRKDSTGRSFQMTSATFKSGSQKYTSNYTGFFKKVPKSFFIRWPGFDTLRAN